MLKKHGEYEIWPDVTEPRVRVYRKDWAGWLINPALIFESLEEAEAFLRKQEKLA